MKTLRHEAKLKPFIGNTLLILLFAVCTGLVLTYFDYLRCEKPSIQALTTCEAKP